MKLFIRFLVILSFLIIPCNSCALTVAAASSLQLVLQEISDLFEKETQAKVEIVYGSSGKLTAQIQNGAPFDIFLSADMECPETVYKEGLAFNRPKQFVSGGLVLWTIKDIDLSRGFEILFEDTIRKIAIADPKTAPYGLQAVNAIGFYKKDVGKKLVYGESIGQVNQFIISGAADVGFTAKSVVLAPNLKGKGKWVDVDPKSYSPIAQGVVVLKHAKENDLKKSQQFFDFLFSDKAQEIFKKYGYTLPSEHE